MSAVPPPDRREVKEALAQEVERLVALVRSARRPNARALGEWTVADVATHLSHAFEVVPSLARAERDSPLHDLWELGTLTTALVREDPERGLRALADRIESRAAVFLDADPAGTADEARPWLVAGTTASATTFACHLLNEAMIHGFDIARAEGRRWPISSRNAGMVLTGFLIPVLEALAPETMVDQRRAAGVRACYHVHIKGAGRVQWSFDDGALLLERPSDRRVDCHIRAEPAAMLLVAWGRTSQWSAIAKGQLLAWGRRPWLGIKFAPMMRNP